VLSLGPLGKGERVEFLLAFKGAVTYGFAMMAWIFVVLACVERLFPKDRPSERVQLRALRFWFFYAIAGAALGAGWAMVQARLEPAPLVLVDLRRHLPLWAAYVVGPLVGMIFADFFNYWMHRAQHRWFWQQHAVHHSIRNLSAVNSYMHWTEELFRLAFVVIPTATVFNLNAGGLTLVSGMLLAMHGNFIHSASTLHFGKTGRLLLADNRWHRIHHSVEREHWDKNFGTGTTLWDRLFGTAYFPENSEWPKTGVRGQTEIETVSDYLWRPFRNEDRRQSEPRSPSPTHTELRPS
jgi:sterol desaturase/sphingolipid hydroxylase (fatty acid hydroxylase superfamily)